MNSSKEWESGFIARLEGLVSAKDRGALATLRRGVQDKPPYEVYKWLPGGLNEWQQDAALLVAALFAWWHQGKDRAQTMDGNLGKSFAEMQAKDGSDSIEQRFVALLNAHEADLPNHLRQGVSLLKSKEVPINWIQLLRDVIWWNSEAYPPKKSWARSFWSGTTEWEKNISDNEE